MHMLHRIHFQNFFNVIFMILQSYSDTVHAGISFGVSQDRTVIVFPIGIELAGIRKIDQCLN